MGDLDGVLVVSVEQAVAAPHVLDAVAEEAAPVESATAVPYLSVASRAPADGLGRELRNG